MTLVADVLGRAVIVVSSQLDQGSLTKAGAESGNIITRGVSKTVKVAAAGIATVLGASLVKGFGRLDAIDQAEAKLRGLGNSAGTVEKVMDNALASVRGTAFGLGDAATVAASALASGVKPGADLERTLKLVGDAATIGGSSLSEMGAIFNKVSATGKVQGEVLNQLGERGIPILQLLAKELGVTAEEAREMASKGEVDFNTFRNAIESGMGGAALESGKTFSGALANAGAALGRFGAALLGPAFASAPALFSNLTEKIDSLIPAAEKVGAAVSAAFAAIGPSIGPAISEALNFISDKFAELSPTIDRLKGAFEAVAPVAATVGAALAGALGAAVVTGINLAVDAVNLLSGALDAVITVISENQTAFTVLASVSAVVFAPFIIQTGIATARMVLFNVQMALALARITATRAVTVTMAAAQAAYNATLLPSILALGRQALAFTANVISMTAMRVALLATTAASRAAAIAQLALNAAMSLNPIGLIVIALVALGAAFVVAYKKSETFRNAVNGAFTAIKNTVTKVFNGIKTTVTAVWGALSSAASKTFSTISGAVSKFVDGAKKAFEGIKKFLGGIWDGLASGASKAFGAAKTVINRVISGINKALGPINTAARVVGAPTIPKITPLGLYTGTTGFSGGLALVGERGPELVGLPRGSNVHRASTTRAALGGDARGLGGSGGGDISIVNNYYGMMTGADRNRETIWQLRYAPTFGIPTSGVTA